MQFMGTTAAGERKGHGVVACFVPPHRVYAVGAVASVRAMLCQEDALRRLSPGASLRVRLCQSHDQRWQIA